MPRRSGSSTAVFISAIPMSGMTTLTVIPCGRRSGHERSGNQRAAPGDALRRAGAGRQRGGLRSGRQRANSPRPWESAATGFMETWMGERRAAKFVWAKSAARCSAFQAAGSIFIDSVGGGGPMRDRRRRDRQCREAGGPLLLTNPSGNIEVDHAASTVEAHTGEGLIEVNQAGGAVIADTRGGSIQIGSARGARCESAAGAIRVKTSSRSAECANRDGQHPGGAARRDRVWKTRC